MHPGVAKVPHQIVVVAERQRPDGRTRPPCQEWRRQQQDRLGVWAELAVHQLRPSDESASGRILPLPFKRSNHAARVMVQREPTISSTSNTGVRGTCRADPAREPRPRHGMTGCPVTFGGVRKRKGAVGPHRRLQDAYLEHDNVRAHLRLPRRTGRI